MVEPSTGLLYQFVQDGNLLVVGGLVAILFNNVEITILDKWIGQRLSVSI